MMQREGDDAERERERDDDADDAGRESDDAVLYW
jgi:hypothetical protein